METIYNADKTNVMVSFAWNQMRFGFIHSFWTFLFWTNKHRWWWETCQSKSNQFDLHLHYFLLYCVWRGKKNNLKSNAKNKTKKCYLKIFPIKINNFFHFINWKISFLFFCLFILFYPEKISKSIQEKTNIHIIRFSVEKGEKKIN